MPRDTIVDWSLFCCILKCIYLHKSFFSSSLVSRAVCFPDRKSGVVAAYFHLSNTLKYCQISNSNNKKNSAFQTENLVLSRRIYISLILWNIVNFQIRTTTKSLKKLTITYLSIGREGASLRGDIWQDTGKDQEVCPSHTKDMLLVWILCKLPSEMISDRRTKSD